MGVLLTRTYQQTLGFSEFRQDLLHHILYMVRHLRREEEQEEINHLNHQEDRLDDSHHHHHLHLHPQAKEARLPEERDSDRAVRDLMIIRNHHLEDKEEDPREEEEEVEEEEEAEGEEVEEEEDRLDHSNQVLLCHDHGESLEETPLIRIEDHQVHRVLTHLQEYK